MRNLVTGASGFLGSHLVEHLAVTGQDVVGLVRPSSDRTHLDALGVEVVATDLGERGDPRALRACLEGVDRVFHCAALVTDWGTWHQFRDANVVATRNLLDAAAAADASLVVHVSSTDVYGHPDRVVDESAPLRRRGWPYGDTKIEAEEAVAGFVRRGLPVTVVRPASLYGPRSRSFVLEALDLLRAGQLPLLGPADRAAGLTEVSNAVDAILLVAANDRGVGRAYNLTDGSRITWGTYFERLAQVAGVRGPRLRVPRAPAYAAAWLAEQAYRRVRPASRPPLTRLMVELLGTEQGFSNARLVDELGYRPRLDFEEGMRRVGDWLRAEGLVAAPAGDVAEGTSHVGQELR